MTFKEFFNFSKEKVAEFRNGDKNNKKSFVNYSVQVKTALMLLCVGVGFSIIGLITGGFNAESEVGAYVIEDLSEVKDLNLDLQYGEIMVFPTNGEMRIEGYNINTDKISSYGNDSTARFVDYKNSDGGIFGVNGGGIMFGRGYYLNFKGFHYEPTPIFKLYIPTDMLEELSLNNDLGSIKMIGDENFTLGNLKVTTNLGNIEIQNVKVTNQTRIREDLGDVDVYNFFTDTLQIENNLGSISFSGDVYKFADFDNNLGSIDLNLLRPVTGNNSPYGFSVNVDLGNIEVDSMRRNALNGSGEVNINIDCNLGDVEINGEMSKYRNYDDDDFDDDDDDYFDD